MQVHKDGSLAAGGAALTKTSLTYQFAKTRTETDKSSSKPSMMYKPHTPMELGDAVLGQLTSALVLLFDHMIPAVHSVVSWE
ncbi:hypothetical protein PF002_g32929, partial [Phytophthora fragariae]